MFCKWCGEELRNPGEFCQKCGHEAPVLSDCGGFYNLVPEEAPKTKPTASIEYANKVTAAAAAPASRLPADTTVSKPQRSDLPPRALSIEQKQKKKKPVWQRVLPIALTALAFIILFSQNLGIKKNLKETSESLNALANELNELKQVQNGMEFATRELEETQQSLEAPVAPAEQTQPDVSDESTGPVAPEEQKETSDDIIRYDLILDTSGNPVNDLGMVNEDGKFWHQYSNKENLNFSFNEPDGKNVYASLSPQPVDEDLYVLFLDFNLPDFGTFQSAEYKWEILSEGKEWQEARPREDDQRYLELSTTDERFVGQTIKVRCTVTRYNTDGEAVVIRIGNHELPFEAPPDNTDSGLGSSDEEN